MRLGNFRGDRGAAASDRLRDVLGRLPIEGLRPPEPFGHGLGGPRPRQEAAAPRPWNAPPAAFLRSGPRPPREVADSGAVAEAGGLPDPRTALGAEGDGGAVPSLEGRLDPGLPGAKALAAVAIVAAIVAGGYLWMSRPAPEPAPEPAAATLAGSPMRSVGSPATPTPAGSASAGTVVVHVAGKVRRPGVVTLPAGARVGDAIRAAGGLRPGAGTGTLNLARRLVDGEQIPVGVPGATPAPPAGTAGPAMGSTPGAGAGTPLDLNAATVEQFQQLPGVGPVLAQRIVDYRTQHGGFRGVEQLRDVSGIGERRFADLKDLVRV
ncbi:MAG: competence protein ComEA helix-hairpin-helix repeat protein [Streptosporangiaceae bacterium]|nr:competence protein ComEA helix-hairpin-helix repeat protein [Streptosporangiaceae bacterium]